MANIFFNLNYWLFAVWFCQNNFFNLPKYLVANPNLDHFYEPNNKKLKWYIYTYKYTQLSRQQQCTSRYTNFNVTSSTNALFYAKLLLCLFTHTNQLASTQKILNKVCWALCNFCLTKSNSSSKIVVLMNFLFLFCLRPLITF